MTQAAIIALKEEEFLAEARTGATLAQVAIKLGVDKKTLYDYRRKNPSFEAALDEALLSGGFAYLDEMRHKIVNDLQSRAIDPQSARVILDVVRFWLEKRFPHHFGAKLALTVEHKVDIRGALDRAKARLASQVIDITANERLLPTDGQSVATLEPAPSLSFEDLL